MAAPCFLSMNGIKQFILERGGKVTNHDLVNNFKDALNDPQYKDIARQQFKEYVNTLATVKRIEGVKYLMLKSEYSDNFPLSRQYSFSSNDVGSPIMSPIYKTPSSSFHEVNSRSQSNTSLPPMAQLPTRSLFEEVCQAVQQQNNTLVHSESSPSNLNSYASYDNYNDTMDPRMQDNLQPRHSNRIYDKSIQPKGAPPPYSYAQNYSVKSNMYQNNNLQSSNLPEANIRMHNNPPPRGNRFQEQNMPEKSEEVLRNSTYQDNRSQEQNNNHYQDMPSNRYQPQQFPESTHTDQFQPRRNLPEFSPENIFRPRNDSSLQEQIPNPPPRRRNSTLRIAEEEKRSQNDGHIDKNRETDEKENVPMTTGLEKENVDSPISVKERAQKLNKIVSETELCVSRNKKASSQLSSKLDPLHREWSIASSKCDYNTLLRLLKTEGKLARAKMQAGLDEKILRLSERTVIDVPCKGESYPAKGESYPAR
ncbi:Ankyrin repeat domain-containing protein SOWAHB [Nymphon striatum]|nr:Ankyrin repeat domain-containing protein SOWAHB [Nymphon striatum]